ncbi:MAG: hypothetical protein Q8T09_19140 [Candidatus Melainabacteria bacterium]|nr:hypothetical protein [Candidatus Melainabacteria bacterium]
MSAGVGLALVPSERDCQAISSLLLECESRGVEFAFALNTSNSIAHLSLMQASFEDQQTAVDLLQELEFQRLESTARGQFLRQPVKVVDVSVWATKIIFLNFSLRPELSQLHTNVANLWLPKALRSSADPQSFSDISEGQKQSISATGYPFSYEQYLPHITLAHLKDGNGSAEKIGLMNDVIKALLPQAIRFERLVAFAVEPLGLCRKIIREWQI